MGVEVGQEIEAHFPDSVVRKRESPIDDLLKDPEMGYVTSTHGSALEFEIELDGLDRKKAAFLRKYYLPGKTQFRIGASMNAIGMSRSRYAEWMNEDEKFALVFKGVEAFLIEEAEAVLTSLVVAGDLNAVKYVLDRRGGKRWTPKAELDLTAAGQPITQILVVAAVPPKQDEPEGGA